MPSPYDMPLSTYDVVGFIRSAMDFLDLVDTDPVRAAWGEPSALEGMSVGAVAVHGLSALDDILLHCERPEPTTARLLGVVEYYRAARLNRREDLALQGHAFIREHGEKHAVAGPDAVLTQKRAVLEQLKWTLPAQDPDKHVFCGVEPADIDLRVDNRVLHVRGVRRPSERPTHELLLRDERSYGPFDRSIALPEGTDAVAIRATYLHGLLDVRVPHVRRPSAIPVPTTVEHLEPITVDVAQSD